MKNICIIFFFFLNLNSDNFLLTLQPEEFPVNANVAIPTINTFCMQEPSTDTTTNPINIYVNSWTFCRDSLSVLEQYDALYKDPLLQIGIFLHGPSNPPAKILGTPQGRRPCNAFFFFFFKNTTSMEMYAASCFITQERSNLRLPAAVTVVRIIF